MTKTEKAMIIVAKELGGHHVIPNDQQLISWICTLWISGDKSIQSKVQNVLKTL